MMAGPAIRLPAAALSRASTGDSAHRRPRRVARLEEDAAAADRAPRSAAGAARRPASAARACRSAGGRDAEADDLDGRLRVTVAEAAGVAGMEFVGEPRPGSGNPVIERDRQLVALPDVAYLEPHLDPAPLGRHAGLHRAGDRASRRIGSISAARASPGDSRGGSSCVSTRSCRRSAISCPARTGCPGSAGISDARRSRSSRATGEPCIGPAPPNGTSVQPRIVTALDRDDADAAHDGRVRDTQDAGGRFDAGRARAARRSAPGSPLRAASGSSAQLAAEPRSPPKPAEHEIGVGDGRPLAARP